MKTKLITYAFAIRQSIIHAIGGARFAKKSLGKSDSYEDSGHVGVNDLKLARQLAYNPPASAHDKFLQQISLSVDVQLPRYMWQEFDTYRIGVSKQSESTMQTLTKDDLGEEDFELDAAWYASNFVENKATDAYNEFMANRKIILFLKQEEDISETECREALKACLPETFLQWRRVHLNYAVLKTIYFQRKTHRNKQWQGFLNYMKQATPYSDLWTGEPDK